jgi:DNA-binding GntR family transcriptional regulator
VRCREHVALADLLLAGDTTAAAALLHEHLATVGEEKVHDPPLRTAGGPSAG